MKTVSQRYYPTIEEIARRWDDEKLEKALKETDDETFEKWFKVYLTLKPIMKEHTGLRRCKDCEIYPCEHIEHLKKEWEYITDSWYEHGSACTQFQPRKEVIAVYTRKTKA